MPIDHGDMFLMSRVEVLTDVNEVLAISPWSQCETERRLSSLVKLGLLEWVGERGAPAEPAARESTPDFYTATTLRPRASEVIAELLLESRRPAVALPTAEGVVLLAEGEGRQELDIVRALLDEVARARVRHQSDGASGDSQRPTQPRRLA